MSRTIAEIYNRLNETKDSLQELKDYVLSTDNPVSVDDAQTLSVDLSSGSKVANWRLWLWIMAVGSWLVENLFDLHKKEISSILEQKQPHHLRWYAEESKKFQYGFALVWKDYRYQYETDEPQARIIKYAAASEQNGKVLLKVAKEVSGQKTPLTLQEKDIFAQFWNRWRDAGVKIEIISQAPDVVKVHLTIVRDRLVLASDNTLLRDPSVNVIDQAIDTFSQSLEFDGILRLSALVDALQAAEGIIDVKLSQAWHKPSGGEYSEVDMQVTSVAGYFVLSKAESTLIYVNQVTVQTE